MNIRILFGIFFFIYAAVTVYSQIPEDIIPNHSFENWTGGEPDGWFTTNIRQGNFVFEHVYPSSNAFKGQLSMAGEIRELAGGAPTIGILSLELPYGFPIDKRYSAILGYYQYTPVGGDTLVIAAGFTKNGEALAGGRLLITETQNTWKPFVLNIGYYNNEVPDHCMLTFSVQNLPNVNVGTIFFIDEILMIGEDLFSSLPLFDTTGVISANSVVSQNFTDLNGTAEAADDFIVPEGKKWTLQAFELIGGYSKGGAGFESAVLNIRRDENGKPGDLVYSHTTFDNNGPNFILNLDPPAELNPGHYWANFYVNMPLGNDSSYFGWGTSTSQSSNPFQWRDPNNIMGFNVPAWDAGNQHGIGGSDPDLIFSVIGYENEISTSIETFEAPIPSEYNLSQNFPNPFNPSTNINFSIPEGAFITLKVYNLQGEEVATLINENLSSGNYSVVWNAKEKPSGIYIYTMNNGKNIITNKMILLK